MACRESGEVGSRGQRIVKTADVDTPSVRLFGIAVHTIRMDRALDIVDEAIARRERLQIGVINAAKVVNMKRDPLLGEDVRASDLILADGIAIVWASRVLGRPLPERVTGIDLFTGILERGSRRCYRIYCLGATEEISLKTVETIRQRYPGIVIAGRSNGYFTTEQEQSVAGAIAASRADVLFVAMTSPKKENFMARWGDTMGVPVRHGVGGSFDVMAGKVERAPPLWQRLGLEWLYRVKQEPRRLWRRYLVTNTLFCGMVISAFFRQMLGRDHDLIPRQQ